MIVSSLYPGERVGGAEYQSHLIATGLANLGHKLLYLATHTESAGKLEDGNIVIKRIPSRMKIGRQKHLHKVSSIIQNFKPDVIYVREFIELGIVSSAIKEHDIPIISMSCHAMETSPFLLGYHPLETVGHLRSRDALAHFQSFLSIRSTAAHVCNTKSLQNDIKRWYPHISIKTIYNGSPVPSLENTHKNTTGQVIWVNNLKRWKRPQLFVELARHFPDYRFVMVGRLTGGRTFVRAMKNCLQNAPLNFKYMGPLPIDQVNQLIAESDLLLYTSLPVEGFGNSFLQAWMRCVPTLSLNYQLDGIPERERIGRCPSTFKNLVADVGELMADEPQRYEMGIRAREYASRNHNPENMVSDYENLFKEVCRLT